MPQQKFQIITLSSGARLLHIRYPGYHFSTAAVFVKAGSRYDPLGKEGMAHFLEHLLMTKTPALRDRTDKMLALEKKGIYYNAMTNREAALYYQIQPAGQFFPSLDMLIDGLNNSLIEKDDVEKERGIILDEMATVENNPKNLIWHLNMRSLDKDGTLNRSLFGDKKSIDSISREDLLSFLKNRYTPENLLFVTLSNCEIGAVKEAIGKRYSHALQKNIKAEKVAKIEGENRIKPVVKKTPSEQISVGINFSLKKEGYGAEETAIMDLMSECLANHWSSLLIKKLRLEKNIAYWVSGETGSLSDQNYASFHYDVRKSDLDESLKIFFREIDGLSKKAIPPSLLGVFKLCYESALIRRLFDPFEIIWWHGYPSLLGTTVESPENYLARMKKISEKYLAADRARFAFIGNVGPRF